MKKFRFMSYPHTINYILIISFLFVTRHHLLFFYVNRAGLLRNLFLNFFGLFFILLSFHLLLILIIVFYLNLSPRRLLSWLMSLLLINIFNYSYFASRLFRIPLFILYLNFLFQLIKCIFNFFSIKSSPLLRVQPWLVIFQRN